MLRNIAVAVDVPPCEPSRQGIQECLRMLADEATLLRLPATAAAIRAAVYVCQSECHGMQ